MSHWTRMATRVALQGVDDTTLELLRLLVAGECEIAEAFVEKHTERFNADFFKGRRWYNFFNGNPGIYDDWVMAELVSDGDTHALKSSWTVKSGLSSMSDFLLWIKPWLVATDEPVAITICDHYDDAFRRFTIVDDVINETVIELSGYIGDDDEPDEFFEMVGNYEQLDNTFGYSR